MTTAPSFYILDDDRIGMAYSRRTSEQTFLARVGVFIVGCTAALTLSFVGVFAFATGSAPDIVDRIPYYVLGMAVTFVAAIIGLEARRTRYDGQAILVIASAVAGGALVFLTLGGEGLVYAARNPDQAFAAQRFLYLVAAGLISTGIGYWGLRHRADVLKALR